MSKKSKKILLVSILAISFIGLFFITPFGQRQSYHQFADQRMLLGIPNFMDVATNLFFLLAGAIGLIHCFIKKEMLSWKIFFVGVSLVFLGSSYYHLNPTDWTLMWDRLPMTIAFMGLFTALISEYIDKKLETWLLIIFLPLGMASVIYWYLMNDLRFYYWIQFAPMLTLPLVLILFKSKYSHNYFLLLALLSYIFAKVVEHQDLAIYNLTNHLISGHSTKHILASLSVFLAFWMLKIRSSK